MGRQTSQNRPAATDDRRYYHHHQQTTSVLTSLFQDQGRTGGSWSWLVALLRLSFLTTNIRFSSINMSTPRERDRRAGQKETRDKGGRSRRAESFLIDRLCNRGTPLSILLGNNADGKYRWTPRSRSRVNDSER